MRIDCSRVTPFQERAVFTFGDGWRVQYLVDEATEIRSETPHGVLSRLTRQATSEHASFRASLMDWS